MHIVEGGYNTALAMSMFAVVSLPLIKQLDELSDVTQLWYADDATAIGEFQELKRWWDNINSIGKFYGYYANEKKTFLLVKEKSYERACECFQGTGVKIRTDGITLLGSPIGSDSFVHEQIKSKVDDWIRDLELLSEIAEIQPQVAFCAFVHGLYSRWTYFFRTSSIASDHLSQLENIVRNSFFDWKVLH